MAQEAIIVAAAVRIESSAAVAGIAAKAFKPHSRLSAASSTSSACLVITAAVSKSSTAAVATADDGHAGSNDATYAAELE